MDKWQLVKDQLELKDNKLFRKYKNKEITGLKFKLKEFTIYRKQAIKYLTDGYLEYRSQCKNCKKPIESTYGIKEFCDNKTCGVAWREKNIYRYKFTFKYRSKSPREFMKALLNKKSGKRKDLRIEDLLKMYDNQKGLCAISGVAMTHIAGNGRIGSNISLDQIKANGGYLKENVQLTTCDANRFKGEMSMNDLYKLCEDILNKRDGKDD